MSGADDTHKFDICLTSTRARAAPSTRLTKNIHQSDRREREKMTGKMPTASADEVSENTPQMGTDVTRRAPKRGGTPPEGRGRP